MPGRQYNGGNYRHGFNGMERDDELKGIGNSYDFGARIYDPRVGRWLSVDPIFKAYESVYAGLSNNPLWFIDPNGKDSLIVHRSSGEKIGNVIIYKLTFEIVQKGVHQTLPISFFQATSAYWINAPKNSDIQLSFQKMKSHKEDPAYNNTIRMWIKRPPGYAAAFMHPTAYAAYHLRGCAATYYVLDEYGAPQVEADDNESEYKKSIEETGKVLNEIYQIYQEFEIGDRKGTFKGNSFFMKTDSKVDDQVMELKKRVLPNLISTTTNSIKRDDSPDESNN